LVGNPEGKSHIPVYKEGKAVPVLS
jgi:hypothetical protein